MDQRLSKSQIALRWTAGLAALYLGVWLVAQLLARLAHFEALADLGADLVDSPTHWIGEGVAIGIAILVAWNAPRWGRQWFAHLAARFTRFAAHRRQAIFAAAALPIVVRLALLPALPIPKPYVPDEFGHLLLADTFASGRLTNPTHPMWRYFESSYIFHQPTYSSLYPIAQGLVLAVPLAFGFSPWWGICLSAGLMCGVLCWMLQAWVPPRWALLGALVAGAFCLTNYWMNSYWGGATGAIGGALLLAALPRLLHHPHVRDAVWLGLGTAVLSQSRPFEGALLCLPVGTVLMLRFAAKSHRRPRILAVFAASAVLIVSGTLYYNYRVTGNPWLLPYQLHQKIYGVPQAFRGQHAILTAWRLSVHKDLWDNFEWQLGLFQMQSTWKGLVAAIPWKMAIFQEFYFPPILILPLLFLPPLLRRADMRFLLFVCAFVIWTELVFYPFFFAHYAAPLYGALLILSIQGARVMRAVEWRGKPVGAALFRWSMVIGAASCALLVIGSGLYPDIIIETDHPRSQIERALEARGGKHLVLVRYTPAHDHEDPWVYNAANIDRAAVVWAREPSSGGGTDLLRYYSDREVWLVNADEEKPRLVAVRARLSREQPYITLSEKNP